MLKPQRELAVVEWLEHNHDDLVLSSIVLAELRYLAAKQPEGRKKKQTMELVIAIDAGVASRFVDFSSEHAERYGELMAERRRAGKTMPAIDGLIAAQALVGGYRLATRNEKDFGALGLQLINPWPA